MEKGHRTEAAQRAESPWLPDSCPCAQLQGASFGKTELTSDFVSSQKTYNKQAHYFKYISDKYSYFKKKKKHLLVLICILYFVEGSIQRGSCLKSILLTKGEDANPHLCTWGFPGAQSNSRVQGGNLQLFRTAVAGHRPKPTKSLLLPQDTVPSSATGRPHSLGSRSWSRDPLILRR